MSNRDTGAVFSQDGVPLSIAAEYQKTLDSRWRFMEVAIERPVTINLPALGAASPTYFAKTTIFNHGLGFAPLFETDIVAELYADKNRIFARQTVGLGGAAAVNASGNIRVYNLDVFNDYVAPSGFIAPGVSPDVHSGIEFLDGQAPGVELGDVNPVGFSADSRKKTLSIHRHGLAHINAWGSLQANVSAVSTGDDTFTVGSLSGYDFTWCGTLGQAVVYYPHDFMTFPAPIVNSYTAYYIIPIDSTHVKLATSYANALAGSAINLTGAGSLPGLLRGTTNPALTENSIYHGVGYPPTFVLAQYVNEMFAGVGTDKYLGPIWNYSPTKMWATDEYLSFAGVQSIFMADLAYVFLKDPMEIAQ